jgi:hypothetical protein
MTKKGGAMTIKSKVCIGLVSLTLLITSCSGGASEVATSTTVDPAKALPYFEELAKNTRVGFEAAEKISIGVASEYAKYQNEYEQAMAYAIADGQNFEPEPLTTARVDESGRILLENTANRITYSDFSFRGTLGLLSDFKVEGRELSGNFNSAVDVSNCFADTQCNSDDSYDFEVLHSYVSASGDLVVTYSFRTGSKSSSVRVDKTSKGLPNFEVVDSSGTKIKATFGIQTFARGETRINVVGFGPLSGGGKYLGTFRFRADGYLYEFEDINLGTFEG